MEFTLSPKGRCRSRREFVSDNTNPTVESRRPYIEAAKAAGYRIAGFYFVPDVKGALERNAQRTGKAKIPVPGIYRTNKIMQMPAYGEGFDELFVVRIMDEEFLVEPIAPDVT